MTSGASLALLTLIDRGAWLSRDACICRVISRQIVEVAHRWCYTRSVDDGRARAWGRAGEVEHVVVGRNLAAVRPRRMILVGCAVLAIIVVFAGTAATLEILQPPDANRTALTLFEVRPSTTPTMVATQLARAGLIRNTWLFERIAHLSTPVTPGYYRLSPAMDMATVAQKLGSGHPDAVQITIPAGLRVTQYPQLLTADLPRVRADVFLRIATTGNLPDGTALSSRFWYVMPKGPQVGYALEGYLAPGTYVVNTSDDAIAVVEQLVDALGASLCPGPDPTHPNKYSRDATLCKAHAAPVASGVAKTSIFAAMEQRFSTSDDRLALYDTLTLASIVVREAAATADASGVAAVYDNRYQAARNLRSDPAGDPVGFLDAPSTVQYARDSDLPPAAGHWWAPLAGAGADIDPTSPYNTVVASNIGLPPGPISAPDWSAVSAVATANVAAPSPDYFVANICGQMTYAVSAAEDQGILVKEKYEASHACRSPLLALPALAARAAPAAPAQLPAAVPAPTTSAMAAVLMDPDTGQVFLAQHATDERAMASTTKIMTALVAITYGSLDQLITVGPDIAQLDGTGASVAYLQPGDVLTLRQLLYGLLLPSGDDAAIVIADGVAGSQAGFVYLMNDEAHLLGLNQTHYVNVHGLDANGHYSSALDLARLTAFALRDPTFAQIVGTATYQLPATASHTVYQWANTDKLLFPPVYPGVLGVKTGSTGNAGECLVFAAQGSTGRLIGVVLDEPDTDSRFTDARALLDWGFMAQGRVNWIMRHAGLRVA